MANHSFATEFETILRAANALDPDIESWRFAGLEVTNVAPGRYEPENQFWHPDRADLIKLARRTMDLRIQRWNGKAVRQPIEEWREQMQQHFGFTAPVGVGGGWRDLLWATFELSRTEPRRVVDIKQKFGGLRVYAIAGDWGLLAERLSVCICEICGAPGSLRRGSWIVTRCDAHVGASPW